MSEAFAPACCASAGRRGWVDLDRELSELRAAMRVLCRELLICELERRVIRRCASEVRVVLEDRQRVNG